MLILTIVSANWKGLKSDGKFTADLMLQIKVLKKNYNWSTLLPIGLIRWWQATNQILRTGIWFYVLFRCKQN